ncbi:MAG: branched-chain amino acid ABC transporter permease [Candidatus Limnocylindrales bacterium]
MNGPKRLQGGSAPLHLLPAGPRRRIEAYASRHQSLSVIITVIILGLLLPVASQLPILNGFGRTNDFVDGYANAGVFILLALGLNVVVGLAGLLDLGYAAFFAIGSYTYAFAASPFSGFDFPFWPLLIIGAFVAAIFGILLGAPTLRLRGDYLAIVTLGFGEIVPIVFLNSDTYTKGTNGISGIYQPSLPAIAHLPEFDLPLIGHFNGTLGGGFGFGNPWPYYFTVLAIIAVAVILLYRLQDSRLGRAWMAIREDELAASAMGINTVTTKLLAFAIGATTSGLAGVFNASKLAFVSPDQFDFTVSFTVLAMVVLGGMGNIWGVAVGAFALYEIQSVFLKQLTIFFQPLGIPVLSSIDFVQYQFLLYGLALVGMMLLRPEGLFPSRQRKRELLAELKGIDEVEPEVAFDAPEVTPEDPNL